MPQIRVTEEVRGTIREMHEQEMTPADIVRELDLSLPTVYRVLKAMELSPNRDSNIGVLHKLSPEDVEDIEKRYSAGKPVNEILADYGLYYPQFYELLVMLEIKPRVRQKQRVKVRNKQLDHAVLLYRETDLTLAEIRLETGIHQPTLHAELRAREIPLRFPRKNRRSPKKREHIIPPVSPTPDSPEPSDGSVQS